jgi:hypothetical protein
LQRRLAGHEGLLVDDKLLAFDVEEALRLNEAAQPLGLGGCSKPKRPDYLSANWRDKTTSAGPGKNQLDVGVATNDMAVVISADNYAYRINNGEHGSGRMQARGTGGSKLMRVDVHKSGTFVAVMDDNTLYYHDAARNWKKISGKTARDVGISHSHIWIVSNEELDDGGYQLYRANYRTNGSYSPSSWKKMGSKGMVKVDAASGGTAFAIDPDLGVYKISLTGNASRVDDVKAVDLAVSGYDLLWIVSSSFNNSSGGAYVYQYRDGRDGGEVGMTKFGSKRMMSISVGSDGVLFGVNSHGSVYRGDLQQLADYYQWQEVDDQGGDDIDVGTGDHAWKIRDNKAYKFTGSSWQSKGTPVSGAALTSIDVNHGGGAVVTLGDGRLYHSKSSGWNKINTSVKAKDVALTKTKMYMVSDEPVNNSFKVHEAPYSASKLQGSHSRLVTNTTKYGVVRIDAGYLEEKGTLVGVAAKKL